MHELKLKGEELEDARKDALATSSRRSELLREIGAKQDELEEAKAELVEWRTLSER